MTPATMQPALVLEHFGDRLAQTRLVFRSSHDGLVRGALLCLVRGRLVPAARAVPGVERAVVRLRCGEWVAVDDKCVKTTD
jgi:hypothetical protein